MFYSFPLAFAKMADTWPYPSFFCRFFQVRILFSTASQTKSLIFCGQSQSHSFFLQPPIVFFHSFVARALYTFLTVSCPELSPPIHFNSSGLSRSCTPDPIKFLLNFSHSVARSPSSPKSTLSNQIEHIVPGRRSRLA
jgi:hypothetical protein